MITLEEKIGQMIIGGFDGTTAPDSLRQMLSSGLLGGVIYFKRNYETPLQIWQLSNSLQSCQAPYPLFIAIDQEGGIVQRLKAPYFSDFPGQYRLGQKNDPALAFRFGQAIARELGAVGINLNFAPVLDVNTNPANPIIGQRALSHDPQVVGVLGREICAGLRQMAIIPCGKHFPGHGDTSVDSHLDLPVIDHDRHRLEQIEMLPFRRVIAAGLEMLMTAHVLYTELDPIYPATLSPRIIDTILRQEWGFDGLIITDDLEMKGISGRYDVPTAALLAVQAGCDLLLICKSEMAQRQTHTRLCEAVQRGEIPASRIEQSFQRIMKRKAALTRPRLCSPPPDFSAELRTALTQELLAALDDGRV
jgi:beta-N-acetylhexosaminidase